MKIINKKWKQKKIQKQNKIHTQHLIILSKRIWFDRASVNGRETKERERERVK